MSNSFDTVSTAALLLYVLSVAGIDLRTRRIPNALSLTAVSLALPLGVLAGGWHGLLGAAGGMAMGAVFFLPFYLAGGFGAGDVKAMATIGAFLGPQGAAIAAAYTLIIGTVLGIAMLAALLALGGTSSIVPRWMCSLTLSRASGRLVALKSEAGDAASTRFPYGFAIACGALGALWWQGRLESLIGG